MEANSSAMKLAVGIRYALPMLAAAVVTFAPGATAQTDPFRDGVNYALRAVSLGQTAATAADWNQVAKLWIRAVASMQDVPLENPRRAYAEKKVVEYLQNFVYAQQQAAIGYKLNYPTFNSEVLDRQLELYLSYIAAVGRPDVAIVGSSRALQGVNPTALQDALAARGLPGRKIFNFGINGATAQVVSFLLRSLLTPEQLPRQIIWADGVRAFNSGRDDRTYWEISSSPGYRLLAAGVRPDLTSAVPGSALPRSSAEANSTRDQTILARRRLENQEYPQADWERGRGLAPTPVTQRSISGWRSRISGINAIDANGFLPITDRFQPDIYYSQRRRVQGSYDGDYANFWLGGEQEAALREVVALTKARKIPLLIVNLPLTSDYLDRYRLRREWEFDQYMQRQSRVLGFVWRDLSQSNLSRNEYFQDPSHMNIYGATAVARTLANDRSLTWP
ncbi:hypothetical protein [[Phormidium] sp. ETS-05]|uniref:hypothetical protein n=1 Tax=[Phormidium] sp. ETS-05 TaxID=222819 RepID=UPI0018EED413|nr:hypothetical protein [[Phormidium] sp. ETS-05]